MRQVVLKNVNFAQAYPEDVVGSSKTMEEHITYLKNVFAVINED